MTGGARRGTNKTFSLFVSDIVPVTETISLDGIDCSKPHCFAGVQFFASDDDTIPAIPTSGTVTIQIETLNTSPILESIPDNVIDIPLGLDTKSWAANTSRVVATPASIVGASHYRLAVSCNET